MLTTEVIPSELIFEEIDGMPLFYKGYKQVLQSKKEPESIMGSSFIQSLIVNIVCAYLKEILSGYDYWVVSKEVGLHLSEGNNLPNDIAVFDKASIKDIFSENYVNVAPRIAIEVDTKIESEYIPNSTDYIFLKSEKLMAFGVERVIWILTGSRKIVMTDRSGKWTIHEWDELLPVFDNHKICLNDLLRREGVI